MGFLCLRNLRFYVAGPDITNISIAIYVAPRARAPSDTSDRWNVVVTSEFESRFRDTLPFDFDGKRDTERGNLSSSLANSLARVFTLL